MRFAALQFDVRRGAIEENLAAVEAGLRRAADEGVDLVCLPEMWPTSFVTADEAPGGWIEASAAALERLAALSRELELVVAGSAFAAAEDPARPFNRLHAFDRGESVLTYDKVHLFSPTAEAEGFSAGDEPPATVNTAAGLLSGVVCYDLRFEPVAGRPFHDGAEVLVVPAQWPAPRASHWRALVIARAVQSQCFVVAANRIGTDHVGRRRMELAFPGNSLVVDPAGRVLAQGAGEAGLVSSAVELDDVRRLRIRVPVAADRRPALYRRWSDPEA